MSKIIRITGGLGAGKSVISNILRALNFPVYDCDTEARNIMNHNVEIKQRIAAEITPEAINTDGSINRIAIANCVFSNKEKRFEEKGFYLVSGVVVEKTNTF